MSKTSNKTLNTNAQYYVNGGYERKSVCLSGNLGVQGKDKHEADNWIQEGAYYEHYVMCKLSAKHTFSFRFVFCSKTFALWTNCWYQ